MSAARGTTMVVGGTVYNSSRTVSRIINRPHTVELPPPVRGQASVTISLPRELETVRFSRLTDIKDVKSEVYYQPKSKIFGALDAFVFVDNACYGLQMTLNWDHEIKDAPL